MITIKLMCAGRWVWRRGAGLKPPDGSATRGLRELTFSACCLEGLSDTISVTNEAGVICRLVSGRQMNYPVV